MKKAGSHCFSDSLGGYKEIICPQIILLILRFIGADPKQLAVHLECRFSRQTRNLRTTDDWHCIGLPVSCHSPVPASAPVASVHPVAPVFDRGGGLRSTKRSLANVSRWPNLVHAMSTRQTRLDSQTLHSQDRRHALLERGSGPPLATAARAQLLSSSDGQHFRNQRDTTAWLPIPKIVH